MTVKMLDSFYVRFYLGDEQDEILARHMQQFNSAPRGAKPDEAKRLMWLGLQVETCEQNPLDQDAIRHVVREALSETQSALIDALSSPDLDATAVRRAVQEAMQDTADNKHPIEEIGVQERERLSTEDLASIRRVVDAALQQHLDRLRINGSVQCNEESEDGDDEDDEARVEALMKKLDGALM